MVELTPLFVPTEGRATAIGRVDSKTEREANADGHDTT